MKPLTYNIYQMEELAAHSVQLNRIAYEMARALGHVQDDEDFLGNPDDLLTELLEALVQARFDADMWRNRCELAEATMTHECQEFVRLSREDS